MGLHLRISLFAVQGLSQENRVGSRKIFLFFKILGMKKLNTGIWQIKYFDKHDYTVKVRKNQGR